MRLKLLDLFCCAGGASAGYVAAGFDVVGVDINPQPRYPYEFIQSDAVDYLIHNWTSFDAIHASPPCQEYSMASMQHRLTGKEYPDLIEIVRRVLELSGKPYVIENVPGSPLISPVELCGSMFGLRTYRHRLFETNWEFAAPAHPEHVHKNAKMGRKVKEGEFIQYVGHFIDPQMVREMTGLHWMNRYELAQSIPPQYTEYIGNQLYSHIAPF